MMNKDKHKKNCHLKFNEIISQIVEIWWININIKVVVTIFFLKLNSLTYSKKIHNIVISKHKLSHTISWILVDFKSLVLQSRNPPYKYTPHNLISKLVNWSLKSIFRKKINDFIKNIYMIMKFWFNIIKLKEKIKIC